MSQSSMFARWRRALVPCAARVDDGDARVLILMRV
jgi:hypothetical protein